MKSVVRYSVVALCGISLFACTHSSKKSTPKTPELQKVEIPAYEPPVLIPAPTLAKRNAPNSIIGGVFNYRLNTLGNAYPQDVQDVFKRAVMLNTWPGWTVVDNNGELIFTVERTGAKTTKQIEVEAEFDLAKANLNSDQLYTIRVDPVLAAIGDQNGGNINVGLSVVGIRADQSTNPMLETNGQATPLSFTEFKNVASPSLVANRVKFNGGQYSKIFVKVSFNGGRVVKFDGVHLALPSTTADAIALQ